MMKSPTRFTLATYALALAVATVTANSQPAQTPYGIGAHPAWLKQQERAEEFRWMAATGIQRVRVDFSWQTIQRDKGGPFDFSRYDEVLADAKDAGLAVLPLLGGTPRWASPVYEHIDDWERFVEATVAHYGDRFDEIEPFSEQDVPGQFGDWRTVATNYFPVLRAAYNAAKRANPKIRVFLGGVANIPLDYLGKIYDMGGAAYFDAMNVHPYCHPFPPEKRFDTGLESLRRMMDSRGDSRKPIVVTEIGWPTHATGFSGLNVLPPALKIARPERRTWRTVYAATMPGPDGKPPTDIAEAIEKVLPQGSSVEACFSARLKERLAVGDVDLVIYPLDESFPADTFGEVADFVDRGGVLADFGGVPLCYPVTESAPGLFAAASADVVAMRRRLRITETAFWNDSALPDGNVPAFPTEAALAAGFKGDPAGEKRGSRYQTPALMRPGDEFIPLLTVKDAKNRDATVASVTRLAGGTNGCVIVSGFMTAQAPSANEIGQARYVARTLAIAMAVGV